MSEHKVLNLLATDDVPRRVGHFERIGLIVPRVVEEIERRYCLRLRQELEATFLDET